MDEHQIGSKQIYSQSSSDKYSDEFCCSYDRGGNMDIIQRSMTIHLPNSSQSDLPYGSAESEWKCGDTRMLQREDSLNGLYVRYRCFNYNNAICECSSRPKGYKEPRKSEDPATYIHSSFVGLIYFYESGNKILVAGIYAPTINYVACHKNTSLSRLPLEKSVYLEDFIPRLTACCLCHFLYFSFPS